MEQPVKQLTKYLFEIKDSQQNITIDIRKISAIDICTVIMDNGAWLVCDHDTIPIIKTHWVKFHDERYQLK